VVSNIPSLRMRVFIPLRYGDLSAENCVFFLPLCHSASQLWNFTVKLSVKKLESWGYSVVKVGWSSLASPRGGAKGGAAPQPALDSILRFVQIRWEVWTL